MPDRDSNPDPVAWKELEDTNRRNIVRSVFYNDLIKSVFSTEEVDDVFMFIKEEQLHHMYWSPTVTCNGHEKYDPSMPFYEQCLIDYNVFRTFFNLLSPWGRGENAKVLCARIFKLIDDNQDNMLSFLEFLQFLAIVCRSDIEMKLKLLYLCHLTHSPGKIHSETTSLSGETEEAAEAEEFFSSIDSDMSIPDKINDEAFLKVSLPSTFANGAFRAKYLASFLFGSVDCLPSMLQEQFIDLWKSLYDMFVMHEEEQKVYHCIATVGTLLLQIGEMGSVVQSFDDLDLSDDNISLISQSTESVVQSDLPSSSSQCKILKHSNSATGSLKSEDNVHKEWSITFKQFQGTLYTQQFLVSQFDHRINLSSVIESYRKRCFEKIMAS